MKKRLAIGLLVVLALSGYALLAKQYRVFPFYQLKAMKLSLLSGQDDSYIRQLRSFDDCKGCPFDIVMLGDSLTAHADWSMLLPYWKVANRGISGDDTRGVRQRMGTVTNTGASRAFVMLGINDLYDESDVDDVVENYREIIRILLQAGIRPVIQSTLFVGPQDARLRSRIASLNVHLKEIAEHNPDVLFIDLNTVLSVGGDIRKDFTTDGIHLNAAAYRVWSCYLMDSGYLAPGEAGLPGYCRRGL